MQAREVLNNLLSQSHTPFTATGLEQEIQSTLPDKGDLKEHTFHKLEANRQKLISAINLDLLSDLLKAIKTKSLEKFALEDLKISADPSLQEVTLFLSTIHQELHKIQTQKEEIFHFISFFNSAKGYLTSFYSSAEIILRVHVEGRKDFKNAKDALLNDVEVYKDFITNNLRDLNRIIEEVLSPRMNLCVKMESSVRLLEKYRNPENSFHIQRL